MNPNPRIGVLLRHHKASVRLFNILNPRVGMQGLARFFKEWTEDRRRRELPGWGVMTEEEFRNICDAYRARLRAASRGLSKAKIEVVNE